MVEFTWIEIIYLTGLLICKISDPGLEDIDDLWPRKKIILSEPLLSLKCILISVFSFLFFALVGKCKNFQRECKRKIMEIKLIKKIT